MKYRDDFFYLLNRLVNDGPLACGLSFLYLPFKYRLLKADECAQKDKRKRTLIEQEENRSWDKLTAQFPSFSQNPESSRFQK